MLAKENINKLCKCNFFLILQHESAKSVEINVDKNMEKCHKATGWQGPRLCSEGHQSDGRGTVKLSALQRGHQSDSRGTVRTVRDELFLRSRLLGTKKMDHYTVQQREQ